MKLYTLYVVVSLALGIIALASIEAMALTCTSTRVGNTIYTNCY